MNTKLLAGILLLVISVTLMGKSLANLLFNTFHIPRHSGLVAGVKTSVDRHILYVSDQTGSYNIFRMDLLTKRSVNLSHSKANDMNPQVSPDGKSIVFYSDRSGNNQIYRMTLATGKVTRLTNNQASDYDPTYSPDGKLIAFKSTRDDDLGDIFIMHADGSNQQNLTANMNDSEEWNPKFSKNGTQLFFVVRRNNDHTTDELYRMNIDGTNVTQLTQNSVPDWYPSVNPVNGTIIYISKPAPGKNDAIYSMSPDGTHVKKLTDLPGNSADPSWNLFGNKIVFINDNEKNYNIFLVDANGSNMQSVTSTPHNELSPIFIP